jgi:hypothetical protein
VVYTFTLFDSQYRNSFKNETLRIYIFLKNYIQINPIYAKINENKQNNKKLIKNFRHKFVLMFLKTFDLINFDCCE